MELMISSAAISSEGDWSNYDKAKEVKAFDETKAGVKGLVDIGVTKIPRFFIHPPDNVLKSSSPATSATSLQVPLIDFQGFGSHRRKEVVEEIRKASEIWGFFQMINHGIPITVMDEMIAGVKRVHELPVKLKEEWYSRDRMRPVRYFSNGDLVKEPANWRDTITFVGRNPALFPETCRDAVGEYTKHLVGLKKKLSELLSEALGLPSDYLSSIECMETESLICHYYPPCPEPDLTMGVTKHTDPDFLTIVLQDSIGGLQVLHQGQWVEVGPMHGSLVVNIWDFLQIVTNDKFRSVEHRVVAGWTGPRMSAAWFVFPVNELRPYGAIKELLSDKPAIYRETSVSEYVAYFNSRGLDGNSKLSHFKRH